MNTRADLFDNSRTLVPQYGRQRIGSPVSGVDVVVAVAHAGAADIDHNLSRSRVIKLQRFDDCRFALLVDNCGESRGGHGRVAPSRCADRRRLGVMIAVGRIEARRDAQSFSGLRVRFANLDQLIPTQTRNKHDVTTAPIRDLQLDSAPNPVHRP